ncbi:hypothetical protein GWI33_017552 [Rhynchophorus ferrugineus]|uniref:Uncharacterized protein n=1 Tax=Rhynchophorus ferrugineus TaxID=354439 RepID=A0A834HYB8_RHYFE|nr:hypothetical protein GWI33_017552 [Rhynchophorus ferrugineus]
MSTDAQKELKPIPDAEFSMIYREAGTATEHVHFIFSDRMANKKDEQVDNSARWKKMEATREGRKNVYRKDDGADPVDKL